MGNTKNSYGKPVYDDNYSFPQDSQDAVDFADEFANTRIRTAAGRAALLPGQIREGMLVPESDTGDVYQRRLGSWTRVLGDTGWQTPSLLNSWANYALGFQVTRYRRLNGIVHIEGHVKSGTVGLAVFTLPAGFRPLANKIYATPANAGVADVRVLPDGTVYVAGYYAGGTNAIVGLNISFPAEQ